jgi:uncharacterized membrane protein
MCGCSRGRVTSGVGRGAHFDSELSHAVTTTMPASMSVAVIMVFFLCLDGWNFERVGERVRYS